MSSKENLLSRYIDSLNEERKPSEHSGNSELGEMEELFETVRLVRSLREPSMPDHNYPKKLANNISKNLLKDKYFNKSRKRWLYGAASVAAAAALIITLNTAALFGKANIVYAMEQVFKEVEVYHGVLEIIETNADGKSTT